MRVLLTGATGMIGSAVARALLARGHVVVCAVREPARLSIEDPRCESVQVDLARVPDRAWWTPHLAGVDVVINTVGILREAPGQRFDALHHEAPAELFRASADAGVRAVVQVSALGADAQAASAYHLSKRAADDVLRGLGVPGAVVQPSLVFAPQGESAGLFLTLATLPVLAMPQRGGMAVQPVHLDDVVDGIVKLVESPPPQVRTIAFVGPQPMPLRDYLAALRTQLGRGAGPLVLPMPTALFTGAARVAGQVPGSFLDAETAAMLLRGNAAPAGEFTTLLGRTPCEPRRFIAEAEAPALRIRSALGIGLPLLRVALAFMWIWTGIVSLGLYPVQDSYALLAAVGLHGGLAVVALYGAAVLDIALGMLTLRAPVRWRWLVWATQLLLIAGYTVIITIFLPEYWLHPYGPISKNLPIMAAIALLWLLDTRAPRR